MSSSGRTEVSGQKGRCLRCNARWTEKNAGGLARQHYTSTGHPTEWEQTLTTTYGEPGPAGPKEQEKLL